MPSREKLRIGLVGCGRIAQSHILAARTLDGVEVAAIADTRAEVGETVAEELGLPRCFTDHLRLLDAGGLDAVIVCTPPATHRTIVEDCLSRGLPVYCEKPFTLKTSEAETLAKLAAEQGLPLMMASKFRFTRDVIAARGILESGLLGTVILLEVAFCSRVSMVGRWNAEPQISGGGVLADNGPHVADIVRFLVGPVTGVQARFADTIQKLPVEDTAQLRLAAQRVLASADLSWSLNKESPSYVRVYGSSGTLEIGWQQSRFREAEKVEWTVFGDGYRKEQAFSAQLAHFVEVVRGTAHPLITVADAVASVRVVERAYEAAQHDGWLTVED